HALLELVLLGDLVVFLEVLLVQLLVVVVLVLVELLVVEVLLVLGFEVVVLLVLQVVVLLVLEVLRIHLLVVDVGEEVVAELVLASVFGLGLALAAALASPFLGGGHQAGTIPGNSLTKPSSALL